MKKTFTYFLLTSAFATCLAFAQRPGDKPPTAANFAERRIQHLTTLLSLTSDQQQQATTIFASAATAQSAVRDGLKNAHQALKDAVKTNNLSAIEQASTTIGNLTAQSTSANAKADAAFYQILTPDQQTKLNQIQDQHHGPFGGAGLGGPSGFRGGRR